MNEVALEKRNLTERPYFWMDKPYYTHITHTGVKLWSEQKDLKPIIKIFVSTQDNNYKFSRWQQLGRGDDGMHIQIAWIIKEVFLSWWWMSEETEVTMVAGSVIRRILTWFYNIR